MLGRLRKLALRVHLAKELEDNCFGTAIDGLVCSFRMLCPGLQELIERPVHVRIEDHWVNVALLANGWRVAELAGHFCQRIFNSLLSFPFGAVPTAVAKRGQSHYG